jgi:hypothetical protein
MITRPLFLGALAALVLSVPALAQTVDRIVPEAFAIGDVVILKGSGLGATTTVPFKAVVGGFAGVLTINQPISVATDTEVLVVAPEFNAFVPPFAGSSPFGTVAGLPGFYMEGTFGQTDTGGKGSPTPGSDLDKLVASFDLTGGAPTPGNANFKLKLEDAPPGAAAFVIAGLPATVPVIVGEGVMAVDVASTFILLGPFAVDAQGDAVASLPVPAGLGITVAMQWGLKDPGSAKSLISNGLIAQL